MASQKRNYSRLILAAILVLLTPILAACGGGGGTGDSPAGAPAGQAQTPTGTTGGQAEPTAAGATNREPATVTIWSWREQDEAVWKKAEEALQKTWPGLTVKFEVIKATEYDAKVTTAMQGGQGPDIITTRAGSGYFEKFAEANMFVPLTDRVPDLQNIPEGTIKQVSYQNEVYAVPFASQISLFYYNKGIFDKYNLSPPKTWDELMQMCNTLKQNNVTPLFVPAREGWALSLYVDLIGATYLGDEYTGQLVAGEKTFTDPKFVSLYKRIQDLRPCFQEGYVGNNYDDMQQAFMSGRAAMMIDGGWSSKGITEQAPDIQFDFFLSPLDEAGGKQSSYVFVDGGYAVNSASKVQDAALELVRYAGTKEYGQTFTNLTGEMSAIPGVQAPADNPHLQRQLELAGQSLTNLFRIRSPFDDGDPGISTLQHPLMEGLVAGRISPEEVAKQIQEGVGQWYEPFQKQQ